MTYTNIKQTLQTTAFGDLDVAQLSPKVQLQFPYNINPIEVNTTATGSGTVSFLQPFAVCSTGSAASSSSAIFSKDNLHYASGEGGLCLMTAVFSTGVSGSRQWVGLANTLDALWFGYNGSTFGINRRYNNSDNFVSQSSWNVDRMDGTGPSAITLVPTEGNVYKIQYQWLGFGCINFYIENPATASFQLVHVIEYPNSATTTSLLNPAMQLNVVAQNTSNTSNIIVKSPSLSAFVQGAVARTGNNFSIFRSKSIATTLTSVFVLRNNPTFNGITNYKSIFLTGMSFVNGGNSVARMDLILNGTIGGSPSYTNINSQTSIASYDVAGTSVTGGSTLITFFLAASSSMTFDISNLYIHLEANDVLAFAARRVSGGGATFYASLNWIEQF
ncbi:MAG: hypothetical protein Q8L68_01520 [Methylococcales bacterium]|nr:hypothetical protein [Methylococcales bacterium]